MTAHQQSWNCSFDLSSAETTSNFECRMWHDFFVRMGHTIEGYLPMSLLAITGLTKTKWLFSQNQGLRYNSGFPRTLCCIPKCIVISVQDHFILLALDLVDSFPMESHYKGEKMKESNETFKMCMIYYHTSMNIMVLFHEQCLREASFMIEQFACSW